MFAAQLTWIDTESRLGSHRAADHHAEALADVKASVGRLVNAQPHQIALLDSASRSWSTAMGAALNAGRPVHVITTDLEYGANAICLLLAAKRGALTFSVLPVRTATVPLSQQVAEAIDATPRHLTPIVSLPLVSAAWGLDIVRGDIGRVVARIVRERDGYFFVDASHAVGQVPVDAEGCDAMVFPARKWLRGPKGVGVLCLSDRALAQFGSPDSTDAAAARWLTATQAQPHSDARRFEGYEFNPGLRL
ncbi:MAG: aminotransferase class V-fold PLP-dependent enzyme, partial [Rhizobiales bacterium]|nr:aminotransferase class V-fold PLP-dependent enzyme [Rhizobacter sp.]